MNEESKGRGRPRKHLQDERHFKTSDDAAAAGAPPAAADSGQADASDGALAPDFASAELIHEAVVENPTIVPVADGGAERDMTKIFSESSVPQNTEMSIPSVESANLDGGGKQNQESPIEQKIHVMVEQQRVFLGEPQTVEISQLNGWHPIETDIVLNSPARNGMAVKVSQTPDGEGVVVFWKRFRAFSNATKRLQETGNWVEFHTGQKIDFVPKYWKERY